MVRVVSKTVMIYLIHIIFLKLHFQIFVPAISFGRFRYYYSWNKDVKISVTIAAEKITRNEKNMRYELGSKHMYSYI